ncbi:hypothetical protein [Xanthobacter sp. KR7-225]|uniref:hypothetical protein n=1 Tax=Xanthobacter sp. KR7-225 TaxID=3156613 RepID=UPI0032B330FD
MRRDDSRAIRAWMPIVWYDRYSSNLPDICVGEWPAIYARSAAKRWKIWFVDTPGERRALDQMLDRPARFANGVPDFRAGPDLVTSAPSRGEPFLALYPPPKAGWPWITVRSMPGSPIALRHRYIWECEEAAADALAHFKRFVEAAPNVPAYSPDRRPAAAPPAPSDPPQTGAGTASGSGPERALEPGAPSGGAKAVAGPPRPPPWSYRR